jgi:putative phosphoribosyl transferase
VLLAPLVGNVGDETRIVLGIPRGGVVVAAEVARALQVPLDVLVVRKLGVPGHEEFGFGAIGEGGVRVLDEPLITQFGLSEGDVDVIERRERAELARRVAAYREGRASLGLAGRHAILVDDGVAMGGTIRAAARVVRALGAARVTIAVGVGSPDVLDSLRADADRVVAALAPARLGSVGAWYADFRQVTDDEVLSALASP